MMTWSKGAVLVAVGLVLVAVPVARSQSYLPTPFGPARMPEPTPCAVSQPLAPGPLAPLDAPPGPPSTLCLPSNHSSAFQDETFPPECGVYANVGAMALQRQGLGTLTLGTRVSNGSPAQDLGALVPEMGYGVRASLGYLFNDSMFEVTGFAIPDNSQNLQTRSVGNINVPFVSAPTAFTGLFTGASTLRTSLDSRLWNVELNYRYNSVAFVDVELIMGLRFVEQHDALGIFVDDPGSIGNGPSREFNYGVSTDNRLIAPQLGFEYQHSLFKYLSIGMNAKGAWGANFASVENSLIRGDNVVGFDTTRNDITFSHLYEINGFVEFHILERLRLRGGYDAMWLLQWTTAPQNAGLDLGKQANPNHNSDHNGSIFYHGPTVELEFLF